MGHRADARGSMGWQRGEVAIIYRQKLPSSAFFGVGGATPGFDPGIEILGLLIYTYEPQTEVENSALNSPNLRGKM